MTFFETKEPYSIKEHNYGRLEELVQEKFDAAVASGKRLFLVNIDGKPLSELYVENLEPEHQQHYTCRNCLNFIDRYGNLVLIDDKGRLESAIWDLNETPNFFKLSVTAILNKVLGSKIAAPFITDEVKLGNHAKSGWTHLHLTLPKEMKNTDRVKDAYQKTAEYKEEFKMLNRAVREFSYETACKAVELLSSETMYRSDRVLGVAKFFKSIHEKLEGLASKESNNVLWTIVMSAPAGMCHIRSSMIGTLLEDLQDGLSPMSVKARFEEKMNPDKFMRSQSAPSKAAVLEAERLIATLGMEPSLQRRMAAVSDIPSDKYVWTPRVVKQAPTQIAGGVFGSVVTKETQAKGATDADNVLNLPKTVMTWHKFVRTVLDSATQIEVLVKDRSKLMQLVTAAVEDSPQLLAWDNPFSWYYNGGVADSEMKRRVESNGGQYEDNDIRCSLMWNSYTDLDLHAGSPDNPHIYYRNKGNSRTGGYLDIDMNAGGGMSMTPVENIRWGRGLARNGRYVFKVHNYADRNHGDNPFKVELEVEGQIFTMSDIATRTGWESIVFQFDYVKGQIPQINAQVQYATGEVWNTQLNGFAKVTGIIESPNMWNEENQFAAAGHHTFFLLDGVSDDSTDNKGKGFFNEFLVSDLRPIRKTLEGFTDAMPVADVEGPKAAGVGYIKDRDWNLTLRVTTGSSTRLIEIDRWD